MPSVNISFEPCRGNVSIPLLAVAARDDPITHCDALRAKEFSAENQNLLFLVTVTLFANLAEQQALERTWRPRWLAMGPAAMESWLGFHERGHPDLHQRCERSGVVECVEGVLVAEPFPAFEAASLLPMMQLLASLLGERLTSMHWEAEARRSQTVINRLLQGVEVLAKPSEEWEKNLMQSAAEVPNEVLRGDVIMKDAAVWQLDKRTYVDICGQMDGSLSLLAEEAFTMSSETTWEVSCAEENCRQ
eukprot:s582_g6.t1